MIFTLISAGGSIHPVEAESVEAACIVIAEKHNWQVTHVIPGEFAFERRRYQHEGLHQYWQLTPKTGYEPNGAMVSLAIPARQMTEEARSTAHNSSGTHPSG